MAISDPTTDESSAPPLVLPEGFPHLRAIPALNGFTLAYDSTRFLEGKSVDALVERMSVPVGRAAKEQTRFNIQQFASNLMWNLQTQRDLDRIGVHFSVWTAVPLKQMRTPSRYRPSHVSYRQMSRILKWTFSQGWIERITGDNIRRLATCVRPSTKFIELLDLLNKDISIARTARSEYLILRNKKRNVEYLDTRETNCIREEVNFYNKSVINSCISIRIPAHWITDHSSHLSKSNINKHCTTSNDIFDSYINHLTYHTHDLQTSRHNDPEPVSIKGNTSDPVSVKGNTSSAETSSVVLLIDRNGNGVVYAVSIPGADAPPRLFACRSPSCSVFPIHVLDGATSVVSEKWVEWNLNAEDLKAARIFSRGSFSRGGRWYAPYQSIPSALRRLLWINGEPTVELDYGSIHLRMIYDFLNIKPDRDDLYLLDIDIPRATAKAVAIRMFNTNNQKQLNATIQDSVRKGSLDLNGYTAREVIDAFKRGHPDQVCKLFHTDMGITLMKTDSDLAGRIVRSVINECGVAPLIVHDSFIVPQSHENSLRSAMEVEYEKGLGALPIIKRTPHQEHLSAPPPRLQSR